MTGTISIDVLTPVDSGGTRVWTKQAKQFDAGTIIGVSPCPPPALFSAGQSIVHIAVPDSETCARYLTPFDAAEIESRVWRATGQRPHLQRLRMEELAAEGVEWRDLGDIAFLRTRTGWEWGIMTSEPKPPGAPRPAP